MLPSLQLLEKVSQEIMSIPNRQKESKRGIHYGLFLLGYKSGLRVSEAVSFDLANKTKHGLYHIEKPKGKKERFVYIPKKVIGELKRNNWQPNQTNRFNFYHFLKKVKRELNISGKVELTPHALRRSFATYHAENGLSLPILSKMLGHSSVRTTALYWRNIYQEPDNDDIGSILAGKNWLEKKKLPHSPTMENFAPPKVDIFPKIPKNSKPVFIDRSPVVSNKNPTDADNYLSTPKTLKKTLGMLINGISPTTPEKFFLNLVSKKSDQLKTSQPLPLITNKEQNSTEKELILLQKIKHLEEQLKQTQTERDNLKIEKEKAEAIAKQEKQRADNYQQQLKTVAKTLYQWQKVKHYQQLEQEQKAQVEQLPPWKSGK